MAHNGIALVFGGGRVGLMGIIADAILSAGGEAIGVMPRSLVDQEIAHAGLTSLHVVDSMHDRKLKMAELSDAFLALPGGAGTLEELFEQWTWAQLGIHQKPCSLLNVAGYFDPLTTMIERMVSEGFLRSEYAGMLIVEPSIEPLLGRLHSYNPPPLKWVS